MALVTRLQQCAIHGLQPHTVDQPNHLLHGILTLCTGVWGFVWIYVTVKAQPAQCQSCVSHLLRTTPSVPALPPGSGAVVPPPRVNPGPELPNLVISVVADSTAGLFVTVRNDRADPVRVLWDESTATAPGGRSLGRLIKAGGSASGVQPASPVVPGATLVESCVPEHGLPVGVTGHGQLYLVLDTEAGKETWKAGLVFGVPPRAGGDAYR